MYEYEHKASGSAGFAPVVSYLGTTELLDPVFH